MADAVAIFYESGLMNHPHYSLYFEDIINQPCYEFYRRIMAQGMVMLHKQGILNPRHINFIAGDCAISYAELLIELDKASLLNKDNAEYHLDLVEKHHYSLHMARALILRQQYRDRFTKEEYETHIDDQALMQSDTPEYLVKLWSLIKIISTYKNNPAADKLIDEATKSENIFEKNPLC